ncbi:MAG: hypothetical protein O3A14_02240 [Cyanobacteria bacterium]|nr:hypothetical protein [Cyanobacteriota bacterium]
MYTKDYKSRKAHCHSFPQRCAILLDTGATRSPDFFPLRQTVDALIDQWLTHHPRDPYPLCATQVDAGGDRPN